MHILAKNLKTAKRIQERLRDKVLLTFPVKRVKFICGLDASYSKGIVYGCASLFNFPELEHLEDAFSALRVEFPYIPGFLSFREGKALISAYKELKTKPDVLLIDGHGIAHPKSLGIATHLGIILSKPSVGCAKSVLLGEYVPPGEKRGSYTYLTLDGREVGAVLRTKDHTKPVFVSPGHMVDLHSAIDLVLKCSLGYRIPEPLRRAHTLSKRVKNLSRSPSRPADCKVKGY